MTRLLDRLEDKGLIARRNHPGDRRSIVIALTDDGRGLVPHLRPVFRLVTRRLLAGFSEHEAQQATAMLQRMLDNLRTDKSPSTAADLAEAPALRHQWLSIPPQPAACRAGRSC